MIVKPGFLFGIALFAVGASFWAGSVFQKALYHDRCLDLGGGQNPENHPICVVEAEAQALRFGPIMVTERDLVRLEVRYESSNQARVYFTLEQRIASALAAFTSASVGQHLDIWVGNQMLNSVYIAEGVTGDQFILPLNKPQAENLERLLSAEIR